MREAFYGFILRICFVYEQFISYSKYSIFLEK